MLKEGNLHPTDKWHYIKMNDLMETLKVIVNASAGYI